jgi:hypothetical protein
VTFGRELGREVDLDLLADYIGGALDGTPQAATVERLVADDPAWARAYAETRNAIEAVRVDLGALAVERDRMPADVVSRLDAALSPVLPQESGQVVELAARRRWVRRLTPVAVAAGVLLCVGLGATFLRQDSGGSDASGTSAGNATVPAMAGPGFSSGEAAPQAGAGDAQSAGSLLKDESAGTPRIVATGTDYTPDTLRLAPFADLAGPSRAKAQSRAQDAAGVTAAPAELRRLIDPTALAACLAAIKEAHAQPAASVQAVDLARYEGSPAVVVRLTDAGGAGWVWVSGPDCGVNGAATRFSTQVS